MTSSSRAAVRTDSNSSKATGGEFLQSLPALGHESAESPMTVLFKRVETTLISYDCLPIQISFVHHGMPSIMGYRISDDFPLWVEFAVN